jgi:hypothetical protein
MTTFFGHGSRAVLASVAQAVDSVPAGVDVHTITLVLNGQHGEFDLTILGSDEDMEDVTITAIAHRSGGISDFEMRLPV